MFDTVVASVLLSLTSYCWQAFKVTVHAVHQAVGHTVLICCCHIQKKKMLQLFNQINKMA